MKKYGIITIVIALAALLSLTFVFAKEGQKDEMKEKQELAQAAKISMADALAIASKQASGTVLSSELESEDGKIIYSFDILPSPTSSSIKEVNIDATNGAVIAVAEETPGKESAEKDEEMKEGKEKGEKVSKESKGKESEDEEKEEKMTKESKEKDSDDEEKEEQGEHGDKGKWEALKVKVASDKLPAAVKSAVSKEISGGKIESATTMEQIYSVKVTKGAESSELLVTAAGKVIDNEKSDKEDDEKDEKGEKEEKD